MDPSAAGRLRGFRAPGANEVDPSLAAPKGASSNDTQGQAETLEVGPPVRRRRLAVDRRWLLAGTAGLVAIMIIAALAYRLGSTSGTSSSEASATPTRTPVPSATPLPVPDLYNQTVASVVLITTTKGSLGSGVIVTDAGLVLTAHHVVSGGGRITIVFADGTKAAANVASASPKTDTALLVPQKLPEVVVPATLGGGVAIGSDVVAIGNPLGLRASTTTGVVSGLGRRTETKSGPVSGLIQFDAAVNPGSSGGPLLNAQGLVVGVVVSIADPGRDDAFAGIGFAVPIGAALAGDTGPGQDGPRL
jgi:S1-C subfamily serine protease